MTNRRNPSSGITILEMLLSLAVMAMISIGIGSLFQTGNQVWLRVGSNDYVAGEAVARADLRRELENMTIVSPDTGLTTLFRATNEDFAFVAADEEVWTNVLFIDGRLIIRNEATGTAETVRRNLLQTSFTYFGRKTVREETRWHTNWNDATILPSLIKIETWQINGTANPPLSIQPGKLTRQIDISLSSLVPPD